jgi:hypothetical protein
MSKIVALPASDTLSVHQAISHALKDADGLDEVLIIGTTIDGDFYNMNSRMENRDVLWLLSAAKINLLSM